MPPKRRSMASTSEDRISEIFDEKLCKFKQEIISELNKEIRQEIRKEFETFAEKQNQKITVLESTVAMLQKHVSALKQKCENSEVCLDDREQYGRRVCLRIDGIPIVPNETSVDVLRNVREKWEGSEEIQEKWKKEGIQPIPDSVIDRAHRIGKIYKNNTDNVEIQSVILRLSTFRHRIQIYLARKLMKDVSVKLDLTKYRYSTLKEARERVDKIAG